MKSGSTEKVPSIKGGVDSFLGDCLRAILRRETLPIWPAAWHGREAEVIDRLTFHGIAPFLGSAAPLPSCWPRPVALEIRKTAGLVSFWEASHHQAVAALIESFAGAGIPVLITKGTALAYSLYPEPSLRRRGDTDILILSDNRSHARAVLAACGFSPDPEPRPLQEDWHYDSAIGIAHAVDIHWRPNASAAISQLIERGSILADTIPLPALSPSAKAIGPVGNLLLTAINRHSHGAMGYHIGTEKVFATDRLIWALDIFLLARSFGQRDWERLAEQAGLTGTAAIVLAGLQFAEQAIGAEFPADVVKRLGDIGTTPDVATYFATTSGPKRMWMDLSASHGVIGKARLVRRVMLPGDAFLSERYPDAQGWPRPLLHLRRWVEGAAKLMISKA